MWPTGSDDDLIEQLKAMFLILCQNISGNKTFLVGDVSRSYETVTTLTYKAVVRVHFKL